MSRPSVQIGVFDLEDNLVLRDREFLDKLVAEELSGELRETVVLSIPPSIKGRLKVLAREQGYSLAAFISRMLIYRCEALECLTAKQKSVLGRMWFDDETRPARLIREAVQMFIEFEALNPGRLAQIREAKKIKFARTASLNMKSRWAVNPKLVAKKIQWEQKRLEKAKGVRSGEKEEEVDSKPSYWDKSGQQ